MLVTNKVISQCEVLPYFCSSTIGEYIIATTSAQHILVPRTRHDCPIWEGVKGTNVLGMSKEREVGVLPTTGEGEDIDNSVLATSYGVTSIREVTFIC